MDAITLYILLIIFVAALARSTLGFGSAMLAVPLLSLVIPLKVAVPLVSLISVTLALIILIQDFRHIQFHSVKWLIIFGALGIPVGLLMLVRGNQYIIKAGLGLLIIAYSVYSQHVKKVKHLKKDNMKWLFACGFLSGILSGAYGISSPPLIVYGHARKWDAKQFRATLQSYYLPAAALGLLGYWYKGVWTRTVTHYYLIALPVLIPTVFIGMYLNHKLNDRTFFKYVYWGLIGIGLILMLQSSFHILNNR